MKRIKLPLLFLLLCLLYSTGMHAQGENNVWCFGHRVGLDFNSGSPVAFEHNMETHEGGTSVSDPSGNLLFYTMGSKIWDRNGNLMPNGSGLAGNVQGSSMSGVAIVQSVSNAQQYYILTVDELENGATAEAYYTVVDMRLNGGLGDVVPGQSSVLIDTGFFEGVFVTSMADCKGYWFILRRLPDFDFFAYRIDASGISTTPVVSPGFPGYTRFNNAGNKIINSSYSLGIHIYSFDNVSGIISSPVFISFPSSIFNFCALSPDDQKLYLSNPNLSQLDLSLLPDVTAVQNSLTQIANVDCRDLRLGPDNKMYALGETNNLIRINNPNAPGMACDIDPNFMTLPVYPGPTGHRSYFEFGPRMPTPRLDTTSSVTQATFCASGNLKAPAEYLTYRWNTGGRGSSETVTESGVYWVSGRKGCTWHVDSFLVNVKVGPIGLGTDTFMCEGQTMVLNATKPEATYLWQDGSTDATFTLDRAGTYWVEVRSNGCIVSDTIHIEEVTPKVSILEPDTTICPGAPLTLHASAVPASNFAWNNGGAADSIVIDKAGRYTVTATSPCGTVSDEITVTEVTCNCDRPFVPNAFTPNGDGKNEILTVGLNCPGVTAFHFAIYNRYGQMVFESEHPGQGWNGSQGGNKADIGTYFYQLKYKTSEGVEIKKKGDVILLR